MYPRAPKEVQNVLNDFVSLEVPAISFDELVPGDKTAADLLARVRLITHKVCEYDTNDTFIIDVAFQSLSPFIH